jgi:hypothetical protein
MELTDWTIGSNSIAFVRAVAKQKGKKVAPGLAVVRNPEVTLSWLVEDLKAQSRNGVESDHLVAIHGNGTEGRHVCRRRAHIAEVTLQIR